jgi:hypothetical protein
MNFHNWTEIGRSLKEHFEGLVLFSSIKYIATNCDLKFENNCIGKSPLGSTSCSISDASTIITFTVNELRSI